MLRSISREDFLQDFRNTESAKYLLVVATEAAIDVCNHVATRSAARAPQDYPDCFLLLAQIGAIEPALVPRLQQMARFRNRLVHLYWEIDDARVYEILQDNLTDVDEFRDQVARWVEKEL